MVENPRNPSCEFNNGKMKSDYAKQQLEEKVNLRTLLVVFQ